MIEFGVAGGAGEIASVNQFYGRWPTTNSDANQKGNFKFEISDFRNREGHRDPETNAPNCF